MIDSIGFWLTIGGLISFTVGYLMALRIHERSSCAYVIVLMILVSLGLLAIATGWHVSAIGYAREHVSHPID